MPPPLILPPARPQKRFVCACNLIVTDPSLDAPDAPAKVPPPFFHTLFPHVTSPYALSPQSHSLYTHPSHHSSHTPPHRSWHPHQLTHAGLQPLRPARWRVREHARRPEHACTPVHACEPKHTVHACTPGTCQPTPRRPVGVEDDARPPVQARRSAEGPHASAHPPADARLHTRAVSHLSRPVAAHVRPGRGGPVAVQALASMIQLKGPTVPPPEHCTEPESHGCPMSGGQDGVAIVERCCGRTASRRGEMAVWRGPSYRL